MIYIKTAVNRKDSDSDSEEEEEEENKEKGQDTTMDSAAGMGFL